MLTIKDIAREAGVAPSTVSKVLNNRGGISPALQRRIEAIARRSGYEPYIKARRTGMAANRHVGILYSPANPHLAREIQLGIDAGLRNSGYFEIRYSVAMTGDARDSDENREVVERIVREKNVAGVICVFFWMSDAAIGRLQRHGMPVVLLNNASDCAPSVVTSNARATAELVASLVALGRRKIGLIMPEAGGDTIWALRLAGYKKALAKARIRYEPGRVVCEQTFELREAALATRSLLELYPDTDAIIYGSDMQAYGGMEALKVLGKAIPGDVAVAGFDDLPFSRISEPPLTSVHQPMREMGEKAAHLLIKAIRNKDFTAEIVEMPSRLSLRGSTHEEAPRERLFM